MEIAIQVIGILLIIGAVFLATKIMHVFGGVAATAVGFCFGPVGAIATGLTFVAGEEIVKRIS